MFINRRKFITQTALITASLETLSSFKVPAAAGYSLKVMATNWGFPGSITEFCKKAKDAGYDGIEVWMPGDEKGRKDVMDAAAQHNLLVGFLYGGSDADYAKHAEQFKSGISEAAKLKPLYINCHSGKDYFSFEQNKSLMDFSLDLGAKSGIPVYHETHRGRSLFAAHTTRNFIEKIPNLRLCLDISHWCNVHESLLGDQKGTIDLTLSRVDHIHARVGHAEGPQVSDPRAPEWDGAVKAHFAWWDTVVETKRKEGKIMTILTEFGPPDYLPTLPYTRQPVASQWDINVYMLQQLKKRYA
jgi:sugar phosphate isomerase/epimerase